MAKIEKKIVSIIKPARSGFREKKGFCFIATVFADVAGKIMSLPSNYRAKYGTFASFFNTPSFDT